MLAQAAKFARVVPNEIVFPDGAGIFPALLGDYDRPEYWNSKMRGPIEVRSAASARVW